MPHGAAGWARTCFIAGSVLVLSAGAVWLFGIPAWEQRLYGAVTAEFDQHDDVFFWFMRLGNKTLLLPAAVFLLVLLPQPLLRRWWLWVAAFLLVVTLHGMGKGAIGRARPEGWRPGFPSGHTAAAATVWMTAGYCAAGLATSRWAKRLAYTLAGSLIALVGLSRIVRRAHWPLDAVGGAALGIAVFAAAAWWHERHLRETSPWPSSVPVALQQWIYRWQTAIPIPFFALIFVTPPMAAEDTLLDAVFDLSGGAFMAAALLLRLWAAGHAQKRQSFPTLSQAELVATGPYAYIRHPLPLANVLVGVGLVLLAESGPGLVLIPAVLIAVYRLVTSAEAAVLSERFGRGYADRCARVPHIPWPTPNLLTAALSTPWRSIRAELPFVTATLILAGLADASEFMPRLLR